MLGTTSTKAPPVKFSCFHDIVVHVLHLFVLSSIPDLARGQEPQGFPNAQPGWEVMCHIHAQQLENYVSLRCDARQEQVQQLLQFAKEHGQPVDCGVVAFKQASTEQKLNPTTYIYIWWMACSYGPANKYIHDS
jgi:hypothetical protein